MSIGKVMSEKRAGGATITLRAPYLWHRRRFLEKWRKKGENL